MTYNTYQFVGHAIHTGPQMDPVDPTKRTYVGIDDPVEDMRARTAFLKAVLGAVQSQSTIDSSSEVLKVFVLPEFFFRGSKGAYRLDDNVQALIANLQTLVEGPDWKNWFFIFGTILAASARATVDTHSRLSEYVLQHRGGKLTDSELIDRIEALMNAEIYNLSLCCPGNRKFDPKNPAGRVVMKEFLSRIDFIQRQNMSRPGYYLERVLHLPPAQPSSVNVSEQQKTPYSGESVFAFDGVLWGVEVCLDHAEGRLKGSSPTADIKVQVVPSAGMNLQKRNVVVTDGYVFGCDGLNDSGAGTVSQRRNSHTELVKYTAGNHALQTASVVQLDHLANQADNLFADGPGELHIYGAL